MGHFEYILFSIKLERAVLDCGGGRRWRPEALEVPLLVLLLQPPPLFECRKALLAKLLIGFPLGLLLLCYALKGLRMSLPMLHPVHHGGDQTYMDDPAE